MPAEAAGGAVALPRPAQPARRLSRQLIRRQASAPTETAEPGVVLTRPWDEMEEPPVPDTSPLVLTLPWLVGVVALTVVVVVPWVPAACRGGRSSAEREEP